MLGQRRLETLGVLEPPDLDLDALAAQPAPVPMPEATQALGPTATVPTGMATESPQGLDVPLDFDLDAPAPPPAAVGRPSEPAPLAFDLDAISLDLEPPPPSRPAPIDAMPDALPADAFRLFLGVLGDALTALVPGRREVAVTTSDGSMAVRLTVLESAGRAEIETPDGVFRGPDHLVHIVDLAAADAERSA